MFNYPVVFHNDGGKGSYGWSFLIHQVVIITDRAILLKCFSWLFWRCLYRMSAGDKILKYLLTDGHTG